MKVIEKKSGEEKTAVYITTPRGNKRYSVDGIVYSDRRFNALFKPSLLVKHYEIAFFSGEKIVHADGCNAAGDQSLCGADLVGDATLGWGAAVVSSKKINCSHCLAIIAHCRQILESQMGKSKTIEYR